MKRDSLGRRIGHNWWREWIVSEWAAAHAAWWSKMEDETSMYPEEVRTYHTPQPTLKQFMIGLARGSE